MTPTMRRDELVSAQSLVRVFAQLPEDEAFALAQFLKRAGFAEYRRLAQTDTEAYAMRDAAERIRDVLAEAGIAPR